MSHSDTFIEEREYQDHDNRAHEQFMEEQREMEEQPTPDEWDKLEKQSLSALNQFTKGLTKIDIKEMADSAIENLLISGNPLQIAEGLSAMENFIKEVKDDPRYKNYVREEIQKFPKGFTSKSGAKLECAETGTTYDFMKCNDRELSELERNFNEAKKAVDERKTFLKSVPSSGLVVTNEETGETWKCYPPSKSSTSSYKITLSKGF